MTSTTIAAPRAPGRTAGRLARLARLARELLLWLLALLGIVTAAVTVFAAAAGLRPLVVRSGSMEPAIATGAMILVEQVDAAEVAVGDVVVVPLPNGRRVTHRVVALSRDGDTATVETQGDANRDPDPTPTTFTSIERLAYHVPVAGWIGGRLATPAGGFLLGTAVGMSLVAARRRR